MEGGKRTLICIYDDNDETIFPTSTECFCSHTNYTKLKIPQRQLFETNKSPMNQKKYGNAFY